MGYTEDVEVDVVDYPLHRLLQRFHDLSTLCAMLALLTVARKILASRPVPDLSMISFAYEIR